MTTNNGNERPQRDGPGTLRGIVMMTMGTVDSAFRGEASWRDMVGREVFLARGVSRYLDEVAGSMIMADGIRREKLGFVAAGKAQKISVFVYRALALGYSDLNKGGSHTATPALRKSRRIASDAVVQPDHVDTALEETQDGDRSQALWEELLGQQPYLGSGICRLMEETAGKVLLGKGVRRDELVRRAICGLQKSVLLTYRSVVLGHRRRLRLECGDMPKMFGK